MEHVEQRSARTAVNIFALARRHFEQRRTAAEEEEQRQRNSNRTLRRQDAEDTGSTDRTLSSPRADAQFDRPSECTLLVCGAQNCGKSWLVSRFLDSFSSKTTAAGGGAQLADGKTIALEYRFGSANRANVSARKLDSSFVEQAKQLVHVWELAGGGAMASMLEVPLCQRTVGGCSVLLFVDLTRLELLQCVVDPLLNVCRKRVEQFSGGGDSPKGGILCKDKHVVLPPGVPLVLVCARYDEFQNLDSERKRATYRLVRLLAHINGAAIVTLSVRMDSLVQRCRSLLAQLATAPSAPLPRALSVDPQQPLFVVPHGADCLEDIDPGVARSLGSFSEAMFHLASSLSRTFPQQKEQQEAGEEPEGAEPNERRQFAEAQIDALVEERMRKLEIYVHEKRGRQEAERKAAQRRQNE